MRPPERNPWEFMFCVVVALSMFPPAFQGVPLPNSLAGIDHSFARGVAIVLFFGCLAVAAGIIWPDRDTGIPVEQWGCVASFFGFITYAWAVFDINGITASRVAVATTLGVALAALVRAIQLQLYIRKRKREYGSNTVTEEQL